MYKFRTIWAVQNVYKKYLESTENVQQKYCNIKVQKMYNKGTMTWKYSKDTTKVLLFKGTKNVLFLVVQ